MWIAATVALSAVAFVLWLICRGSDGKQAQHERVERTECDLATCREAQRNGWNLESRKALLRLPVEMRREFLEPTPEMIEHYRTDSETQEWLNAPMGSYERPT